MMMHHTLQHNSTIQFLFTPIYDYNLLLRFRQQGSSHSECSPLIFGVWADWYHIFKLITGHIQYNIKCLLSLHLLLL